MSIISANCAPQHELPPVELEAVLAATEVGEVWGVGRRIGAQLQDGGIRTVLDLVRLDPATVRSRWSVVLERTVRELQGMPCVQLEDVPAQKKNRLHPQLWAPGHPPGAANRGGKRVRQPRRRKTAQAKQSSVVGQVLVFVHTSPFRPGPQYHSSVVVPLRRPSADTALIVHAAVAGLHQIYRPGYQLIKAGVMLLLASTGDMETVRVLLGHSSMDCSQRYVDVSPVILAEMFANALSDLL